MDRGAWQTTVHGVARVGHDLEIKPPPSQAVCILIYIFHEGDESSLIELLEICQANNK